MSFSKIIATASYLPSSILTNQDLEKRLDTSDDWITSRTGIKQRHIIGDEEKTSDMAYEAAIKAIKTAKIDANSIDLIIVATTTPDKVFPSPVCISAMPPSNKPMPPIICTG